MRKRLSVVFALAVCFIAGAAQAVSFTLDSIPVGPLVTGNGQLQISGIQFFSPFASVDAGDVTFEVLDDGVKLSGPVSVSGTEIKNFFVLYELTSLGAGIEEASLLLDSENVEARTLGLVLSTKQVIGDFGDRIPSDSNKKDFPFGHGFDMGGFDTSTLAFLKTADWQVGDEDFEGPLGLGRDGAIRLVEAGFTPKQSIRIIDGVTVSAIDGTATWLSSENRFTLVPEPGTAALTALGLLLLGVRSRRR